MAYGDGTSDRGKFLQTISDILELAFAKLPHGQWKWFLEGTYVKVVAYADGTSDKGKMSTNDHGMELAFVNLPHRQGKWLVGEYGDER